MRTSLAMIAVSLTLTATMATLAAASPGSPPGRVAASGGSAIRATGTPRTVPASPSIRLNPTTAYPDNALCDALGLGSDFPNVVTVNGSGFARQVKTVTVKLGGMKVADPKSRIDGTFHTTFSVPAQPTGTYRVLAKEGKRRQASAQLFSSAETCWTANGPVGKPLNWKWSGSGFDAGTTATFKVAGTALKTATAGTAGGFAKAWKGACPRSGTLGVSVTGTFQGMLETLDVGTVSC
jgi:hypothetical protein